MNNNSRYTFIGMYMCINRYILLLRRCTYTYIIDNNCCRSCKMPSQHEPIMIGSKARVVRQNSKKKPCEERAHTV